MSGETELSVICKNCGSEVSPYVTECPYCGTRLRKRAPKLERRGDSFEAKLSRRVRRPRLRRRRSPGDEAGPGRPYATLAAILASAVLLVAQRASGNALADFGALLTPVSGEWWRVLTAPFVYADVGYLFVIAVALAIFAIPLERRLGTFAAALLLIAAGSLGVLAGAGIADARGDFEVIAGGNGMALAALAAWFVLRRAEVRGAIDDDFDAVGVAVAAAVLLVLPVFESTADPFAGLAGGVVGAAAGFAAALLRPTSH